MPVYFWLFWLAGLAVATLAGSYVVKYHREKGLVILGAMLAIYVVSANILVPRLVLVNLFGWSLVLITGTVIWPFTAQLSDMINEIYGKKSAFYVAGVAYLSNVMFVMFILMAMQMTPLDPGEGEAWFRSYFGVAGRVLFASMCSYTLANFADITVFARIKVWAAQREQTTGRLLAYSSLRSTCSDTINMVVDNVVFCTIALYGTIPNSVLWNLIGTTLAAKLILAQMDLPFYWAFRLLTRDVKREF